MLDVIMFIPNTFPTLLHKTLGWGTQNKNHLTLRYSRALQAAREHPGPSRAYLGVGYAANFTFWLKTASPLQLNRTQPKSNLSADLLAERFCRGL